MLLLLKGGNTAAAIAQIKVAPTVKDLNSLNEALATAQLATRWRDVNDAIA
ncbi:MAG: hypothetical protein JWQ03_334, partial [Variovorax sp.]|nr:hypothetical protein [Variovorax sp.]